MSAILLTNASGNQISIEAVTLPNGNQAFNQGIVDATGNKAVVSAAGALAVAVSEGLKNGYRYATLAFAPVATPTDVIEIQGSATKTIRIRRIKVGGVATAAGNMPVQLVRRSATDSGGGMVRTGITAFKADLGVGGVTPAATAVVSSIGSANPGALGAAVGGIAGAGRAQLPAVSTGVAANDLVWEFNVNACVLRGVADFLYLNMNGAALPAGAVFDIEIVTEEDAS